MYTDIHTHTKGLGGSGVWGAERGGVCRDDECTGASVRVRGGVEWGGVEGGGSGGWGAGRQGAGLRGALRRGEGAGV